MKHEDIEYYFVLAKLYIYNLYFQIKMEVKKEVDAVYYKCSQDPKQVKHNNKY